MRQRKALFLDRDGVINEDRGYVHKVEDFVMLPRVLEAVRIAKNNDFFIVIITNQAGIARGFFGMSDVEKLHRHMQEVFARSGASIDAIYFCPHHRDGRIEEYSKICSCRKPEPGMIIQAKIDHNLDLKSSILVGDKESDVAAGQAAGVGLNLLIGSPRCENSASLEARDGVIGSLYDCVEMYCAGVRTS